jgi:tRNA(fMet)-specific endonuclease VapC
LTYLLDTNICIYLLKGSFATLRNRFATHPPSDVGIPAIVKAELYLGAYKSQRRESTLTVLDAFLAPLRILPFGDEESVVYARVRAELESEGKPVGPNDLLIASTALARGAVLVTRNTGEFRRIRGLQWEDWTI